jgi:8-amino-7-oxononanoate synthase
LYPSGFAANVGTLSALIGPDDAIFSDALNHASLIDGCRLSRARIVVFNHADASHLSACIQRTPPFRRGWIVTESLFSMDGDIAPIGDLAELANRHSLALYVDEAHAMGILGPEGGGECRAIGITPDVLVGTFGKAFGSSGACVAGTHDLRTFLWSSSRSHVFTTGLPPSVAASAARAIDVARQAETARGQLRANTERLRNRLASIGLGLISDPRSPIVPIVVGKPDRAVEISAALLKRGYFVQAIRPPTVPTGTARLRITVSAAHSEEQIDGLSDALAAII